MTVFSVAETRKLIFIQQLENYAVIWCRWMRYDDSIKVKVLARTIQISNPNFVEVTVATINNTTCQPSQSENGPEVKGLMVVCRHGAHLHSLPSQIFIRINFIKRPLGSGITTRRRRWLVLLMKSGCCVNIVSPFGRAH